jgi:predicted ATPase
MNVPKPQTRFVGRADDLARLGALYAARTPIVTLWGPPGIGKTRLAIELCRSGALRRDGEPEGDAWFCDLTAARDAADMCVVVARTLGVEAPRAPLTAGWIGATLAGAAPGVLVLDNFEQLTERAEETLGGWAAAAPHICFLATSRERLRLAGEVTHEVLPLGDEAADLFLDRARAWSRVAAPTVLDASTVASLVTRLEGIPLAIELAAARMDVLGPDGLVARLDRRLDVLARAPRDSGPNHATLRQAIDSSFVALTPVEQRALAECAVFRGGFTLSAAEAVLMPPASAPLLDVLQSLRDRSLLRCLPEGGEVRFAFFEAIRAYAAERLAASGDEDGVRARHAGHYLDPALAPLLADRENLAEAATYALRASTAGTPVLSPRALIAALARIEPSRAPRELVALLSQMLALAEREGWPREVLAGGYRLEGRALQLRGRLADARTALERALDLVGADEAAAAEIQEDLGLLHHQCRRIAEARACYATALALHEKLEDAEGVARTLGHLGALHHDRRQYEEALELYDKALSVFRAVGDARREGIFLTNKGVLLQERGAFAAARSAYLAGLTRLAPTGDRRLEGITFTNLGFLDHEVGDLEGASANHRRALAAFREVVDPCSEALCLGRLAMALAASGCGEDARGAVRRAECLLAASEDPIAVGVLRICEVFVAVTAAASSEAAVRECLEEARARAIADGASLVELSDDARTAVRLIEAWLATPSSGARPSVLLVGPGARWFTPPEGDTCDLAHRDVLRRLFLRLVEQHRSAPAVGLTLDALREAGWPSERIIEAAATNRIHVALTELRRRGLRRCLIRRQDKYLLDPALRVVLSDG